MPRTCSDLVELAHRISHRFWPKVDRTSPDECWNWTGKLNEDGYGTIRRGPASEGAEYAHRISYALAFGAIPDGFDVDHACRNHACVNPTHLEAVTHVVNVLRGMSPAAVNARKTVCMRGHNNWYIKPGGKGRTCRTCLNMKRRERMKRQGRRSA